MKKLLIFLAFCSVANSFSSARDTLDLLLPSDSYNTFSKFYLPGGVGATTAALVGTFAFYKLSSKLMIDYKQNQSIWRKLGITAANVGIGCGVFGLSALLGAGAGGVATFFASKVFDPTGSLIRVCNDEVNRRACSGGSCRY